MAGLIVVGGLAVAGCGGGGRSGEVAVEVVDPSASGALARAAARTGAFETGRMHITADYTFDLAGQHATSSMEVDGTFADQGRRSEMTMDMTSYLHDVAGQLGTPAGGEMPSSMVLHMIQDGTRQYMRFVIDPPEPGSGQWYVNDLSDLGLDPSQFENPAGFGGGPTSYLESLKGAGADVVETGRTEIDGVAVTRYEGTVDPAAAVERADPDKRSQLRGMLRESGMNQPMPFVAFVDDDGVLRREEMTMRVSVPGDQGSVSAEMTVDFYDFGADVSVEPPPADQVRDLSELTGVSA